eukprot:6189833-Pleurochrysis_carterae.AAC.1
MSHAFTSFSTSALTAGMYLVAIGYGFRLSGGFLPVLMRTSVIGCSAGFGTLASLDHTIWYLKHTSTNVRSLSPSRRGWSAVPVS